MITMKAVVQTQKNIAGIKAVEKKLRVGLKVEGKAIQGEYGKTITTWTHKPRFQITSHYQGDTPNVAVYTTDDPYWFVHEGVSVLRAVFTNDWVSKTQPGVLDSGAGAGKMLYATKKIAKKSYKPRKFTEKIIEMRQKPFQEEMQKLIAEGIAESSKP